MEVSSSQSLAKPGKKLLTQISYNQKKPPDVLYKKDVLKNFTKFTGKHLCQSLFFNKVAGLKL